MVLTQEEADAAPTVHNAFFNTNFDTPSSRVKLWKRQIAAMEKTFQHGIDSLKPVDAAGDVITDGTYAMDEAYPDLTQAKLVNSRGGYLPIEQLEWYATQGFIGWNMCAVLSQNWLIDKACGVPGQDAVRNGYDITLNDGQKLDPKINNAMRLADRRMNIKGKMRLFVKKGRIFGIRHALFIIDGVNYELPFNPDGIRPGSYRGIAQIDPYWIAPELDGNAAANVASPDFYEPTWWRVNGKRVHRTHFIIMRNGDEVVDILKPAYLYGGIPVPQKIFERVYAAERTANEAPLLAMSKRMTVLTTDTTKIFAPENTFGKQMELWAQFQNNFGVKIIGDEEKIEQHETALTALDETIMTQYQLVAAAANVPATKLLGTTPKGFNATGEYDESSYHEELESIQENILSPFVERHHLCLMRSFIAPEFGITPLGTEITWKPVDSPDAKEEADIRLINSTAAKNYADAGAVDGLDIRRALISDPLSPFDGMEEVVPGGPGDREAQQESEGALEQEIQARPRRSDGTAEDASDMVFDPSRGTLDGSQLITHQKFIDDAIVREKLADADFRVFVTPQFDVDGKPYRMVLDGHHSLAAALQAKIHPMFIVNIPKPEVFNAVTRAVMDSVEKEKRSASAAANS